MKYNISVDVWGIMWHTCGMLLQLILFVTNAKWKWWHHIDNELMFKLVEIFKLVALFVLLLNPSSVLDYSCDVPSSLASLQITPYVAQEWDIPYCNNQQMLSQLNLTSEQETIYEDLCEVFLKSKSLYIYGVLIGVEIINIIYFFILRGQILLRPWLAIGVLFPSGILWATYELVGNVEYGEGYKCTIAHVAVLTRFLSITNFFMINIILIYIFSRKMKFSGKVEPA